MFTEEEAKVYDRQIRLWGIQAQQRIRTANVLVIGLDGVATEVIKNLVLTGINSITLMDDALITKEDMSANLFTRNQIGQSRVLIAQKAVQELNPMVTVNIKNASLTSVLADAESAKTWVKQFNVVVLVNHCAEVSVQLNTLCNQCGVPFFLACTWGYFGMLFYDLGPEFTKIPSVSFGDALSKKSFDLMRFKRKSAELAQVKSIFVVFLTLYKFHQKHGHFPNENGDSLVNELQVLEKQILQELNSNTDEDEKCQWTTLEHWHSKICGQLTFTSSIIGGFLAQDMIRSVTQDAIESNTFFFDGRKGYNFSMGL